MRRAHTSAAFLALALAAIGCGKQASSTDGVRAADCEHLLSHLIVLEKGEAARPVSGFEADRAAFVGPCPRAVTREQLDCYLTATTLAAADACRARADLLTGLRATPAIAGDGGTVAGTAIATASAGTPDAAAAVDAKYATLIADLETVKAQICACKDAACADLASEALDKLGERWEPSSDEEALEMRRVTRPVFDAINVCQNQARGLGGDWDKLLVEFGKLRDKMCACKDWECAQKVRAEQEAFEERELEKAGMPPSDVMERGGAIDDEMRACRRKLDPDEGKPDVATSKPPAEPKPGEPLVLETGVPECDELVKRSVTCADKMGIAADLHEAHADMIRAYQEGGADPATRAQTVEACKEAAKQAAASWDAAGC